MREKVGKSKHYVCPIICAKSKLAKAAGAEAAGQMRDEKLHAVVARSTFPSQNVQNTSAWEHFWKFEMPKKCTPLWRKAHFQVKMSKTLQPWSTFWKLRCRKSAQRGGAKHIFKVKMYTKHTMLGPILEVEMSKKCTPLWREAHVEVKMAQNTTSTRHFWTLKRRFAWQAQVKSEQNVRVL